MSRPLKTVDPKRVIYTASIGHTVEEIAALEDCSHQTIERRFRTQCEKGRKLCEAQIRRKQDDRALAGSDTMLIWLGSNSSARRTSRKSKATGRKLLAMAAYLFPNSNWELLIKPTENQRAFI